MCVCLLCWASPPGAFSSPPPYAVHAPRFPVAWHAASSPAPLACAGAPGTRAPPPPSAPAPDARAPRALKHTDR